MYHSPITHFTCVHGLVCLFFISLLSSNIVSHQLSGNRNMFSLYPNYLRKWRGGERPRGVLWISSDGDDQRIFLGRKTWQAFFLVWFDVSRDFFGIQNNLKIQMVWWISKHKHSISIVHIFCVMSCKANF